MNHAALFVLFIAGCLASCSSPAPEQADPSAPLRLASFHGTATELLYEMGMGDQIVVRDVTSSYPEAVAEVPSVGHPNQIGVEAVLAYSPDAIVCTELVKPEVLRAFEDAGIEVVLLPNPDTAEDGLEAANTLLKRFKPESCDVLARYNCLNQPADDVGTAPTALFVYGHSGNSGWMVAGSETAVSGVLSLGGFRNPAAELTGFKPLTAEAMVAWNPDYIVLFDHTLDAIGGLEGLMALPGIMQVTAGVQQQFLHFPGQAMNGFGPQTCEIIEELQRISTPG